MKFRHRLVVACLTAVLGAVTHAAWANQSAPDYRASISRAATTVPADSRYGLDSGAKLRPWIDREPRRVLVAAREAITLGELTGRAELRDAGVSLLRALFDRWRADPGVLATTAETDFFALEPLVDSMRLAKRRKLDLPDDAERLATQFVRAGAVRQMGDNNQALSRTLGVARALQWLPNDPAAPEWRKYVDENLSKVLAAEDLDENAGLYNAIGLRGLILACEATGRTDALKSPGWKRVFERFRDQVAPSGFMPEYGDDYFAGTNFGEERLLWAWVLERAVKLYDDDTFAETGERLFRAVTRGRDVVAPIDFLSLDARPAKATSVAAPRAEVTTRLAPGRVETPDKLVLRTGDAFVFSDLYASGYHAHQNRRGAILHYEADAVPLFHGLMRQNPETEAGNLFLIKPADEPFPFGDKYPRAGVWHTASLPTRALAALPGAPADERAIGKLLLRSMLDRQAGDKPTRNIKLTIDNLRLEGSAGTKLVDGFEKKGRYELAEGDATQGKNAWLIPITDGQLFFSLKDYPDTFSVRAYQSVKFDWKYSADPDNGFRFVFRAPGIENGPVNSANSFPLVAGASASLQGEDAVATMTLDEYQGFDNRLVRTVVLTREGVLVIRDELTAGKSAKGQTGGPVWHLYSMSQRGRDWFATAGEDETWIDASRTDALVAKPQLGYVVKYAGPEGSEFGVQQAELDRVSPSSTFARHEFVPGTKYVFITVVAPVRTGENSENIANAITVDEGQKSVRLAIKGRVDIEFAGDANAVHIRRGAK
jgi:hypothetical protein